MITGQLRLYDQEYGFNTDIWRSYLEQGVQSLADHFSPDKDCVYILEADGQRSGCIAIAHTKDTDAQLRFFFVDPFARGSGAGNRLIEAALSFCREKGYRHIFLWTCSNLKAARHLYEKHGFLLTQTQDSNEWGQAITEERWDLEL